MGTVYGITRASHTKQVSSPEIQEDEIRRFAEAQNLGEVTFLHEDLGTSATTTRFRKRKQGKWLIHNAKPGDTIIASFLDRLGRSTKDLLGTLDHFAKLDVRVIVIHFLGGTPLDMHSGVSRLIITIFAAIAEFEGSLRQERVKAGKDYRRARGLYIERPSYGIKKVKGPDGHSMPEWDMQQLGYIAEIAERVGMGEDKARIAVDFWRRGIKDHRGKPWGVVEPRYDDDREVKKRDQTLHYGRATQWFHNMKHAGKLPPPWNELAWTIPEPKGYTVEKKPKRPNSTISKRTTDPRARWTLEDWQEAYGVE